MQDHLPSWYATPTKQAILDFVAAVTNEASLTYVPPAARIAVFDNDGTLWCEKPMYTAQGHKLSFFQQQKSST